MCDIQDDALKGGIEAYGTKPPKTFKDYHELLDQKDIEAVFVLTPTVRTLPAHARRPASRQARFFCKSAWCSSRGGTCPPRRAAAHPKQILQTGLARRYSYSYQTVQQMGGQRALGKTSTTSTRNGTAHD